MRRITFALQVSGLSLLAACASATYDVVIRGGTVYDGSGGEPFVDSALAAMDSDMEYNRWLSVGMALDSIGFGDKWDDWSRNGAICCSGEA